MARDRSDYYFNLHSDAKSRYEEKLVAIDLLQIQENELELSKDFTKWPDISYADIFAYLNKLSQYLYKEKLESIQIP